MDFFGVLRKRTLKTLPAFVESAKGEDVSMIRGLQLTAVKATIEALKEMMVGKRMGGHIHVWFQNNEQFTTLHYFDPCGAGRHLEMGRCELPDYPKRGTDGEEVVVMVFKKP